MIPLPQWTPRSPQFEKEERIKQKNDTTLLTLTMLVTRSVTHFLQYHLNQGPSERRPYPSSGYHGE